MWFLFFYVSCRKTGQPRFTEKRHFSFTAYICYGGLIIKMTARVKQQTEWTPRVEQREFWKMSKNSRRVPKGLDLIIRDVWIIFEMAVSTLSETFSWNKRSFCFLNQKTDEKGLIFLPTWRTYSTSVQDRSAASHNVWGTGKRHIAKRRNEKWYACFHMKIIKTRSEF